MFSFVFLFIFCFGNLEGCAPGLKYISPNQASPGTPDACRDCSRSLQTDIFEGGRFFTGLPCCSVSSNKVGPGRLKNATECGRKGSAAIDDDDKIVGGVPVLENEIPWQVALLNQNGSWLGCSAILLSCDPVIVVTAAHCVVTNLIKPEASPPTNNLTLGFGAHIVSLINPSPLDMNEVRMEVEEIIVHPSFRVLTVHAGISLRNNLNFTNWENDIAVLKVKDGSTLECKKEKIWPACLPGKDVDYTGWDRTILSGWGRVVGGENLTTEPRTLKKVSLTIIGDQECLENIGNVDPFTLSEKQICARDREGEKSGCGGDSGGPLVAEDNNSEGYSAVGIVSWGNLGCNATFPNVYTEVGEYLDWIGSQFDLLPPE